MTGARRNKREETGGEKGKKGTALFTVTNAFEFLVAPATEKHPFPFFLVSPQTPLRSFVPVFFFSSDLSTNQKGTACSLN